MAVIGAGRMGAQIAVEFCLHGYEVHVLARDAATAAVRVDSTLTLASRLGLTHSADAENARSRIQVVSSLSDLPRVGLVLESLPEDMELKSKVLSRVADIMTTATIASNTSSLSITELGRHVGHPDRVVGAHYWNPPLLMPLVEVTAGDDTDPYRVEALCGTLSALGKETVLVRHDVPGFIWNRLQFALLREALHLVTQGIATVDDIDTVTRLGIGRRWHHTGLFASIALGGADTWEHVADVLFPLLSQAQNGHALQELVSQFDDTWLGTAAKSRDALLARDLLHERALLAEPRSYGTSAS